VNLQVYRKHQVEKHLHYWWKKWPKSSSTQSVRFVHFSHPYNFLPCSWINRDDIDFSLADQVPPVQEWGLQEDFRGEIEYPTKCVYFFLLSYLICLTLSLLRRISRFSSVLSLTLFIPQNFGAEQTRIYYIGLKGEFRMANRIPVNLVYEAAPQPQDHNVDAMRQDQAGRSKMHGT
jgi:hypothetical protein